MIGRRTLLKPLGFLSCLALGLVLIVFAPPAAAGPRLTTLYSFCSVSDCADGATPYQGTLVARANTFYDTTSAGGAQGQGTVYSLTRKPAAIAFTETVLYSFCSTGGSACTDGADPHSGVVIDRDGNIFGTTFSGGAQGGGAVYKLTPNANGYTETVIHSFCSAAGCADGKNPLAGLILDKGKLYGTAILGGANGLGVVFELVPKLKKTAYTEKVLYSFCPVSGCADGEVPIAPLVMDAHNNLYGTADGGAYEGGVAFALIFDRQTDTYSEQVLYSFCAVGGTNCTDGYTPGYDSLLLDKLGDLFGTLTYGGKFKNGAVFELTPSAGNTPYAYNVLYNFCSKTDCGDGANPIAGLVADKAGDLYGTTYGGGETHLGTVPGVGTVYVLTFNQVKGVYDETVLHTFCRKSSCPDGSSPLAGLIVEEKGSLLGTAQGGGSAEYGTVFRLRP